MNSRQILYIVELFGTFACTWPSDPNSSKKQIIFRNVRWLFAMLNLTLLMISLTLAIYYFRRDVFILMKSISEMTSVIEAILDLILCRLNNDQLQVLVGKVKTFIEVANEHEIKAMERYMDRYKQFLSITASAIIICTILFSLTPFLSAQELPLDGWLPFSIESPGIYCIIYINHVYCIYLMAFCISIDFMIVILFSYSAAKLNILKEKLRHVNDFDVLVSCIKEHQEIIEFVEDTNTTIETLLFKTNATMGSAVICAGFPLIYNQSMTVMGKFILLMISGCIRIYINAWPANDLQECSVQFSQSMIGVQWVGKPKKMKSTLIIMMQRSQKPFVIKIGGLLPSLTLEYFANFITTISSYFMAMRTVIES
ncbi:odorant receptor Or2-like [Frieseomelitta varia]|uniref:odorant receptor Or2-like n=1 Tax=Frieseomelitta varia TaxID=561572 RepID=UPI001CB69A62|nr:odorant receptor Or2-like [Frieseomelitta varia]